MNTNSLLKAWRGCVLLGATCLMAALSPARALEAPSLILEHLTTADGLSQGSVMATLQDSQGFVWFGTEDGLDRFDGHEFVRYAYSPDTPGGLPGNFVYRIAEDARHDLWIALKDAGIAHWRRQRDDFIVYRHDPKNPASLASDSVHDLLIDARGLVWIGTTDTGVDVLDPKTGRIQHLRHSAQDPGSLRNDHILSLAASGSGEVWVGTESGLDRWLPGRGAFVHVQQGAGSDSLLSTVITRVLEDSSGSVWVGTHDSGLIRIDRDGRLLQSFRHDPRQSASLGSDEIHAILEERGGRLWVGTSEGLDLLDRATGQFSHSRHDKSDPESLPDSFIMSLYQDSSGLLWIGTRSGGVSRWNPRSWDFGARRPAWLENRLVTAFADAPGGKVWVGSLGGGLVELDPDTGNIVTRDFRQAIGDDRVMSLLPDHHGTLWVGTMSRGLSRLTPEGRIERLPVKEGDPHALSAPGIMTMLEARNGQIWIGTFGGGANVLDPATLRIRQLPHGSAEPGAISSDNVSAIAEDERGNLWIGTDGGGLDLARPDGSVVRVFRNHPGDPTSLPSNTVFAVSIDAHGRVWVATTGGLARVIGSPAAFEAIRFEVITRKQGLSSDTLYGVVADASGQIWMSGYAGLMRFDPDTGTIKTFHREDGLQGEEFDFGAYYRLRDGRLCFGGPGGFNIFDPERLTEKRQPPRVVLTGLQVLGVPVPSRTPYWQLDRIQLDYRASIVSLDFGVLDFSSPKHNRLAYRLAGLSDQWIDVGSQRRITLTNLDAGNHVLEIRGANSDSIWSETPLRLTLHRDPAPWRSPWAYALYALAVFSLIAWRVRLQRLKFQRMASEGRRLEKEVELRTHELMESNRQLAEAVKAKSSFLDRMSHELRTPMNGVVGMTELLARTELSSTQARLTHTIRSSARVLLQIVNDLLDLSKIQAGKVVLEELPVDLGLIIEECTSLFAGAADSKKIGLIARPPAVRECTLLGDPLRIRQILMNLIGNAVKFTEAGEVIVTADVRTVESERAQVEFTVADTGIGMDAATIGKIFEPFTQADESTTRRFGGSGLGLAICRELAELMGGIIRVESEVQVGSRFHVSLPLKAVAAVTNAPADPAAALSMPPLQELSGHVLLVEDEPVNAEVAQGYLSALGCTSVWVRDGAEAVARYAAERFDLILMDLSMPIMDGFATTALIRARDGSSRHVPIVALTAHDAAGYREMCLKAGMDDLLTKPYTLEQCADTLRRWLVPRAARTVIEQPAVEQPPMQQAAMQQAAMQQSSMQQSSMEQPDQPVIEQAVAAGPANDECAGQPATAPHSGLSSVDEAAVARLQGLRAGLYPKLVDLFQMSSSEALSQLQTALETSDLRGAAALAHKLASAAANVGALVYAREVRQLEQLCVAGECARARELHETLQKAHRALIEELTCIRLRVSA